MRNGFRIYEEMRRYLVIYEEAVSHIWLWTLSLMNFLIYIVGQFSFLFLSAKWTLLWTDPSIASVFNHGYCFKSKFKVPWLFKFQKIIFSDFRQRHAGDVSLGLPGPCFRALCTTMGSIHFMGRPGAQESVGTSPVLQANLRTCCEDFYSNLVEVR